MSEINSSEKVVKDTPQKKEKYTRRLITYEQFKQLLLHTPPTSSDRMTGIISRNSHKVENLPL